MPHHSARYCRECSVKLRNARATEANKRKYASIKASKPQKFCECGTEITHLSHLAIRCNSCAVSVKTERNKQKYWESHQKKVPDLSCKVCGSLEKVEGRQLCKACQLNERSESHYRNRAPVAAKERVNYEQFKDYPASSKEYHRYTAATSIRRRAERCKPCVYLLQCLDLLYIGQTKLPIEIRMRNHVRDAKIGNSKIYEAMRTGAPSTYHILEEVDTSELRSAENYYIASYRDVFGGRVVNEKISRRSQDV